jgi:hypothetical protein
MLLASSEPLVKSGAEHTRPNDEALLCFTPGGADELAELVLRAARWAREG